MTETTVAPVQTTRPAASEQDQVTRSPSFRMTGESEHAERSGKAIVAVTFVAIVLAVLEWWTPPTPVELQVDATVVEYTLPADQPILNQTPVTQLSVSRLERLEAPLIPQIRTLVADSGAQLVNVDIVAGRGGVVNLNSLRLPKGTRVRIAATQQPDRFQVTAICPAPVRCAGKALTLVLVGANAVTTSAQRDVRVAPAPGVGLVELHLATDTARFEFRRATPASGTADSGTVLLTDVPTSSVRHAAWVYGVDSALGYSTILGGTLLLPKLNDRQYVLRPQQTLGMTLDGGAIRQLVVRDRRVSMLLTGSVRALSAGTQSWKRDLMPSMLDILYANEFIKRLVTIFLGAAAVALKVIPWFWPSRQKILRAPEAI